MKNHDNLDFTKLPKRRSKPKLEEVSKPKKRYQEVTEVSNEKRSGKSVAKQGKGRRSWKNPEKTYRRIAFDTPIETQRQLKELLATKFYGKISYQDELINLAIDEFLKKHT